MARRPNPVPVLPREAIEAAIVTHGVTGACQALHVSYQQLAILRKQHAIMSTFCHPLQRQVLAILAKESRISLAHMIRMIQIGILHKPLHRQSLWEACQALIAQGYVQREGHGRQARYSLTPAKDHHHEPR